MTKINLGINSAFALKRWAEPEVWMAMVGQDLDVQIVQFSFDQLDPRGNSFAVEHQALRIREAAKKHGIAIHSTFTGLAAYSMNLLLHPNLEMRLDGISWYESAIRLTRSLGSKATGGHVGGLSVSDFHDKKRKEYLARWQVEAVEYLSRYAMQQGLSQLLWEPMPLLREPPYSLEGARILHQELNQSAAVAVNFCMDLGHCAYMKVQEIEPDPYRWLRELAPLSPVIHLQQTDGQFDRHWPFTPEYNKIGLIEGKRVVEAIEASGTQEITVIIEVFHPFEEKDEKVWEEIQQSVRYWKEILE